MRRMLINKIEHPIEYLSLLKTQSPNELDSELYAFIDSVTVHETSFFRGVPQLESFKHNVLSELIERQRKNGSYFLSIWSAGCSTGEEPYTLAIMVKELLGDELSRWRVEIIGTDISVSVIQKAREALFDELKMRSMPELYIRRYFTEETPGHFRLCHHIANMVVFRVLNFQNTSGMNAMHGKHVIFCRNSLIYIGHDAKNSILAHFERSITTGGCLIIGQSESLSGANCGLELESFPQLIVYRKKWEKVD
jgi:chemotaxis protein methyltransferase CheR